MGISWIKICFRTWKRFTFLFLRSTRDKRKVFISRIELNYLVFRTSTIMLISLSPNLNVVLDKVWGEELFRVFEKKLTSCMYNFDGDINEILDQPVHKMKGNIFKSFYLLVNLKVGSIIGLALVKTIFHFSPSIRQHTTKSQPQRWFHPVNDWFHGFFWLNVVLM